MELLRPEAGLLFWMVLAFAIVFILLAKFGFPVVLHAIDSRKEFIDSSLEAARQADAKLAGVQAESQALMEAAEKQRSEVLREAGVVREQLLAEAREKAQVEGARIIADARKQGEVERQELLRDARRQVALLAVAVTEKMLRNQLSDTPSQTQLAERMLDELEQHAKS